MRIRRACAPSLAVNEGAVQQKITGELEACLEYFRHSVLAPVVRSAVVAATAQLRELEDARGLPGNALVLLLRACNPVDYARVLTGKRYLDRVFAAVLLERGEAVSSSIAHLDGLSSQRYAGTVI